MELQYQLHFKTPSNFTGMVMFDLARNRSLALLLLALVSLGTLTLLLLVQNPGDQGPDGGIRPKPAPRKWRDFIGVARSLRTSDVP